MPLNGRSTRNTLSALMTDRPSPERWVCLNKKADTLHEYSLICLTNYIIKIHGLKYIAPG